jgi:hypothetical protein
MSSDDLMIGLVVGGIGLTVAYFCVAYILWRRHKAAEFRKAAELRKLHLDRVPRREAAARVAPRSIIGGIASRIR